MIGLVSVRAVIVVALLFGLALVTRLYRQWHAGLAARPVGDHLPALPGRLVVGATRTWVVFTTPFCASCGPVERRLREAEPDSRVVVVDATEEPALADAFHIRSAPTVLLADGAGRVERRLVGATAVADFLAAPA
jgi:hypothetical protein